MLVIPDRCSQVQGSKGLMWRTSDVRAAPGPVEATRQALANAGMTIGDTDLVEISEAFAAQVIPSQADLGIDLGRLDVNGPAGVTGPAASNRARAAG